MDEQSDKEIAGEKQRDQMLKLVAKGFYNELTNYGVRNHEIVQVASAPARQSASNRKEAGRGTPMGVVPPTPQPPFASFFGTKS